MGILQQVSHQCGRSSDAARPTNTQKCKCNRQNRCGRAAPVVDSRLGHRAHDGWIRSRSFRWYWGWSVWFAEITLRKNLASRAPAGADEPIEDGGVSPIQAI